MATLRTYVNQVITIQSKQKLLDKKLKAIQEIAKANGYMIKTAQKNSSRN